MMISRWHIECLSEDSGATLSQRSEIGMPSSTSLLSIAAALIFAMTAGCAADANEEDAEPLAESTEAISAPSCSATRASGAVNRFEKGLHDSIAYAEGTEGRGQDGYNVGFAYKYFSSCAAHPNKKTCSGKYCSTAAGRYQFLKATWDATAKSIGATSFGPDAQEKGTQHLITKVRKVSVPSSRALTATEFSNAMKKLSYEWASLPPGRYGQPNRTAAAMRADYCKNVGC